MLFHGIDNFHDDKLKRDLLKLQLMKAGVTTFLSLFHLQKKVIQRCEEKVEKLVSVGEVYWAAAAMLKDERHHSHARFQSTRV